MILKSAIDKYTGQLRDNHTWMKELTHEDMDELIASLRPRPKLYPKLRLHQKISFYLGVCYPKFSFWIDMGGGKTLLLYELAKYWRQCGTAKRIVVFVKSNKAFLTWEKQAKRYNIDIPLMALEGPSATKWLQLETFTEGIILAPYPGAVAMCSAKVKGKKGKNKFKLQPELVDRFSNGVDMMAMDESTQVGHTTSLAHKLCMRVSKNLEYRYALAGRPFGRDPSLLWAQQRIIDRGASFSTKELFQAALFSKEKNQFSKSRYAFVYTYKKSKSPILSKMMQHRSITFEEHEWGDVPKFSKIIADVPFAPDSQEYYRRAAQELVKSRGNYRETKNTFLKMRQITSGFLGFKDDESGEKAQLAFATNPKLETLLDLIEEMPYNRKAVVFYEYTWSAKQILPALFKLGAGSIWLWSGTKDVRKALTKFDQDEDCRVAVVNNKVGAYSIDGLQDVANYLFFYESPVSVIDREQAEKRVKRQGQRRRVIQYDLVVPDSVDQRILDFHKEGKDLMAAIRKDPKQLLIRRP